MITNHILAIDYGLKRTGLAFAIYPILIAHPYKTVPTNKLQSYLEEYIKANTVKTILIGLPLKMNQNNTDVTSVINGYKLKLIQKYPEINVVMYDERFSSLIAKRTMIEGNFKNPIDEKGKCGCYSSYYYIARLHPVFRN